MADRICTIEGCNQPLHARGWCSRHYGAWRHKGDPLAEVVRHYTTPAEAFAARTAHEGNCLVWTGFRTGNGYGLITVAGHLVLTHRYAWEAANGEIPEGAEVDHTCRNRACCNAAHLRLATRHQNMRNRDGAMSTSGTGVRNVRAEGDSFMVRVGRKHVGTFRDMETAKAAAEVARSAYFGEFAGRG